jgi:hypothetical protein
MDAITTDLDSLNPQDTTKTSSVATKPEKQKVVNVHGGRKKANVQTVNKAKLAAPVRLDEVNAITEAGEKAERITYPSSIDLKPDPFPVTDLILTRT